ncbi:MAG: hypothetical protein JSV80_06275 [Acidobacteriota bacterium]|nr:MAG: hypothetical protein JSV80_06275 [Acidobacteriota bacterium]
MVSLRTDTWDSILIDIGADYRRTRQGTRQNAFSILAPPVVLLTVVSAIAGIGHLPTRAAERSPAAFLLFTGNTVGFLDECGCPKTPMGGLDKRAGYLTALRRRWPAAQQLLFDVGNFSDLPGPSGDAKTRGIVQALNKLDYQAVGVGERELSLGVGHFLSLTAGARFPFVSANLVRDSDGATWLRPYKLIEQAGLRVAVIGVTRFNPMMRLELPGGARLITRDPEAALGVHIASLRDSVDLVVVLALVPLDEARVLALRVPGIDLVFGAYGDRVTGEPLRVNRTQILYAGDQGKYLGEVAVTRAPDGDWELIGRTVALTRAIPPDPALEAHIIEVLAEAHDAERTHRSSAMAQGAEPVRGYLGAGACTGCHAEIVSNWAQTRHARAFETLERHASGGPRPNCVRCHVTGYGQPTGFVDPDTTPHLMGVSCEACHGGAAEHVEVPERPYGNATLATCTSCHTAEQDPAFNYYRDRQLVDHSSVAGP